MIDRQEGNLVNVKEARGFPWKCTFLIFRFQPSLFQEHTLCSLQGLQRLLKWLFEWLLQVLEAIRPTTILNSRRHAFLFLYRMLQLPTSSSRCPSSIRAILRVDPTTCRTCKRCRVCIRQGNRDTPSIFVTTLAYHPRIQFVRPASLSFFSLLFTLLYSEPTPRRQLHQRNLRFDPIRSTVAEPRTMETIWDTAIRQIIIISSNFFCNSTHSNG